MLTTLMGLMVMKKKPASTSKGLSLEDIQANGELIMLTVNGPTTYYDYRSHGMGLQYGSARSLPSRSACRYA